MADFKYPLWVREEAARRVNDTCSGVPWIPVEMENSGSFIAICQIILETQEEPEEPALTVMREASAAYEEKNGCEVWSDAVKSGSHDSGVEAALASIRAQGFDIVKVEQ